MFEIVEKGQKPFPVERAILLSLAGHVLIAVLLITAPPTSSAPPRPGGLLAAFVPPEPEDPPIPVVFREAPGPARENPDRADPSDATRRAGGGDPSRSKAATPFFEPLPGIEGLEPGPRAGRSAPATRGDAAPRRGEPEGKSADDPGRGVFGPRGETSTDRKAGSGFNLTPPGAPARSGERLSHLDQAIRDAARDAAAAGSGQEGAGFPNPDGGFVDSGPLSFDTTWYDWGPYAAEMVRRIRLNWEIPELARLGWKGKLTIRFFILADGTVADATIIRRSGVPPFDFAALQAILRSSPFRPLPRDLQSQREGVTVTFFYNIRPEKEARPEGTK